MLGLETSGPKHQIFLVSSGCISNFSAKYLDLSLASCLWLTLPSSISSAKPSGKGLPFMKRRLCLLGDLDRHILLDSQVSMTTTGSDLESLLRPSTSLGRSA